MNSCFTSAYHQHCDPERSILRIARNGLAITASIWPTIATALPAPAAERVDQVVSLVLSGDDTTGLFYGQLHQNESPVHLIVAVGRRLLDRLDKLNERQQISALNFLCDPSLGPLKSCTVPEIRNRLDQLDRKQRDLERSQADKAKR